VSPETETFETPHLVDTGSPDDDGARVLDTTRTDPIDGVGASDPSLVVDPGRKRTGQGGVIHPDEEDRNQPNPHPPVHSQYSRSAATGFAPATSNGSASISDEFILPKWLKAAGVGFLLIVIGAVAFAVFEPIQVLPRLRLAPGYSLVGQDGTSINSEQSRGALTLYSFASTDCDEQCDEMYATMAEVSRRVPNEVDLADTEFRQITIALNPEPTPEQLVSAATGAGADGQQWQWASGDQQDLANVVRSGFGVYFDAEAGQAVDFDSRFILVDGAGVVRGDYRYQTIANDADKLLRHINILAEEVRNAHGATAVAYEAAHLFLCYP